MLEIHHNLRDVIARLHQFHNHSTREALLVALFRDGPSKYLVLFALFACVALYSLAYQFFTQDTSPCSAVLDIARCVCNTGIGIGDLQRLGEIF